MRVWTILLVLACWCRRSTNALSGKFASIEHASLDSGSSTTSARAQLTFPPNFDNQFQGKLNFGSFSTLIALAGDFYGPSSTEQVICFSTTQEEREERWAAAFEEMWAADDSKYLNAVKAEIQLQADAIRGRGSTPSEGYLQLNNERYLTSKILIPLVSLALVNFDHFADHECAAQAYSTGQQLATRYAALPTASLHKALAMSAFASHSLTDMFSTGHMRTPRHLIYRACGRRALPAALTAMQMHDEESYNGLEVTSARHPAPFHAYGDAFGLDAKNLDNYNEMVAAVNTSMWQVLDSFAAKLDMGNATAVLQYVPTPTDVSLTTNNTCPLYSIDTTVIPWVSGADADLSRLSVRSPRNALYGRPCTTRQFVPWFDCYGFNDAGLSIAGFALLRPSVVYDKAAGGYVANLITIPQLSGGDIQRPMSAILLAALWIVRYVWGACAPLEY